MEGFGGILFALPLPPPIADFPPRPLPLAPVLEEAGFKLMPDTTEALSPTRRRLVEAGAPLWASPVCGVPVFQLPDLAGLSSFARDRRKWMERRTDFTVEYERGH